MKKCPECMSLCYTATTICPACGHEFEVQREASDDEVPDEDSALLSQRKTRIERWNVRDTHTTRHVKEGKPDSLRVDYVCGLTRRVSEWICFEHTGYARIKAESWWRARLGQDPVPATVSEAQARIQLGELATVLSITVDTGGKYTEIKGVTIKDVDTHAWKTDAKEYNSTTHNNNDINYDDIPF